MDIKRLQEAVETIETFRNCWADTVTEKETCIYVGDEWTGGDQISDWQACNQVMNAMKDYIKNHVD